MKLVDVHPDGRAFNVVDSIRRVSLTPGRARRVSVAVGSTAMTFVRGHRIRVHVASSNYPRFARNPAGAADQSVYAGGRRRTRAGSAPRARRGRQPGVDVRRRRLR